jgi:hypothetical protein
MREIKLPSNNNCLKLLNNKILKYSNHQCFRQRNALGHQFYMILKFLKKSECYRRVHGGAISGGTPTIVTGIKTI